MKNQRWNDWEEALKIQKDIRKEYSIAVKGMADAQRHKMVCSLLTEHKKAYIIAQMNLQARKPPQLRICLPAVCIIFHSGKKCCTT